MDTYPALEVTKMQRMQVIEDVAGDETCAERGHHRLDVEQCHRVVAFKPSMAREPAQGA